MTYRTPPLKVEFFVFKEWRFYGERMLLPANSGVRRVSLRLPVIFVAYSPAHITMLYLRH
ncbi:MAG TPA: hypothetical protein VK775_12975 [Chthoniobacterales bacterium]|nr:hypothetical protein [Chthoniobacterales bacterium]